MVLSQFQVCTIRINLTGVSQWQADVVKEAPKLTAPAALKSATLYDFRALGISSNVPSTDQSTSNPLNGKTRLHCGKRHSLWSRKIRIINGDKF